MSFLNDLFTFGPAYNRVLDEPRIMGQMARVKQCMSTGQWMSLNEIATITGDPESSISAQLRHCRKAKFGGYLVEKRRKSGGFGGTWEYRLMPGTIPLDTATDK